MQAKYVDMDAKTKMLDESELLRMLKERGYGTKAIVEIMKWYD